MKRYITNETEVEFLSQMIKYLSEEGNSLSDKGSNEVREVIGRIRSRPHLDLVIDHKVFEDYKPLEVNDNV